MVPLPDVNFENQSYNPMHQLIRYNHIKDHLRLLSASHLCSGSSAFGGKLTFSEDSRYAQRLHTDMEAWYILCLSLFATGLKQKFDWVALITLCKNVITKFEHFQKIQPALRLEDCKTILLSSNW